MNALTEVDAKQLDGLLKRAIANNQFNIAVASPLLPGDHDEFGDGDRHDGNGVCSALWKCGSVMASGDDPYTGATYENRAEVYLLVDDADLCRLAGVSQREAEQIVGMRC